ncbi:MAG: IclR family transcriptional regulator [Actinobacteria bacterium]|nr:IclR family transcriptional regulator [Actinomycetota bacterium]
MTGRSADDRQNIPVRAVGRAIDLLFALTEGPRSLGEIAAETGLTKATTHRLLASLAYRHLVIQEPVEGRYVLGPGCLRFVEAVGNGLGGVTLVARPLLEALRDATGETVTIHMRVGAQRVCLEELPSPHTVRYTAGIGAVAPVHVGAAGHVLLAFMSHASLDRLLASMSLDPITERTVSEEADLRSRLDVVRERGWAESQGERVPGAKAVSVPIFGPGDILVAALSVLAPEARLSDRAMDHARKELQRVAEQIRTRLGTLEQAVPAQEVSS